MHINNSAIKVSEGIKEHGGENICCHIGYLNQGAWVAQWVKCLTLDFGSGRNLRVVRSSPTSGSMLLKTLSLPLPPPLILQCWHSLSFSKKPQQNKNLNHCKENAGRIMDVKVTDGEGSDRNQVQPGFFLLLIM